MNIFSQITESYRLGVQFFYLAFPLVLICIGAEALQHYVEYKLGMFSVEDGNKFTREDQYIRLSFGFLKVLSIIAIGVVLPRFIQQNSGLMRAIRTSGSAWLELLKLAALMGLMIAFIFLIAPAIFGWLFPGMSQSLILIIALLLTFIPQLIFKNAHANSITTLLSLPKPNQTQIERINRVMFSSGIFVMAATILPAMALHYYLGMSAFGQRGSILFLLLALDSVVVGLLACLLAAAAYVPLRDICTQN